MHQLIEYNVQESTQWACGLQPGCLHVCKADNVHVARSVCLEILILFRQVDDTESSQVHNLVKVMKKLPLDLPLSQQLQGRQFIGLAQSI